MERSFDCGAREPEWTLADLVRDPLIGLVMQSDGVDRGSIERLFERVAQARWAAARRTGARR